LAVVVAGLISGNVGLAGASPTTKVMLFNLWEFLAFLANSLVFLLIGLNVDLVSLWANRGPIAIAVLAVLASRAVVVYGLPMLLYLGGREMHIPRRWQHVLFWGGLRGAISLALALSLPILLPHRETLLAMTFGVLLFTLLAQGTTIQFLLQHLGLVERPAHEVEREMRMGELYAAQAGLHRLEGLYREGLLTEEMWAGMREDCYRTQQQLVDEIHQLFIDHPELEREMLLQARREALWAERSALNDALRRGLLSEHVYDELKVAIDYRLEALDMIQSSLREEWAVVKEG
jgi:CPA1 family monovalent cation:H+ antiporter